MEIELPSIANWTLKSASVEPPTGPTERVPAMGTRSVTSSGVLTRNERLTCRRANTEGPPTPGGFSA
jgi:hypothetical protein